MKIAMIQVRMFLRWNKKECIEESRTLFTNCGGGDNALVIYQVDDETDNDDGNTILPTGDR